MTSIRRRFAGMHRSDSPTLSSSSSSVSSSTSSLSSSSSSSSSSSTSKSSFLSEDDDSQNDNQSINGPCSVAPHHPQNVLLFHESSQSVQVQVTMARITAQTSSSIDACPPTGIPVLSPSKSKRQQTSFLFSTRGLDSWNNIFQRCRLGFNHQNKHWLTGGLHLVLRVLTALLMIVLLGLLIFFQARPLLMSRPPWIYGSPMNASHIQSCLVGSQESPKLSMASPSNTTGAYWEWHIFSPTPWKPDEIATAAPSYGVPREEKVISHVASDEEEMSTPTTTPRKGARRVLIAQYSGYGSYAEMMDAVAPVNAAYARAWGQDYLILQGTALDFSSIIHENFEECPKSSARATFNKIPILEEALRHKDRYDQVLILDTDTLLVDFSEDISKLLVSSDMAENDYLMAGQRVYSFDFPNTWDVNAGVTLWNLHHPLTSQLVQEWKSLVISKPKLVLERNDDQFFLQVVLKKLGFWKRWRTVTSHTKAFNFYQGTLVKHFKRRARNWEHFKGSMDYRMDSIHETIRKQICGEGDKPHENMKTPQKWIFSSAPSSAAESTRRLGGLGSTANVQRRLLRSVPCRVDLETKFASRQEP